MKVTLSAFYIFHNAAFPTSFFLYFKGQKPLGGPQPYKKSRTGDEIKTPSAPTFLKETFLLIYSQYWRNMKFKIKSKYFK